MVFSTNLARQFYVMKGAMQTSAAPSDTNTVQLVTTNPNAPYLVVKGAVGTSRTDLLTNIECVKVTHADALKRPLKSVSIKLDTNVNNGQPIVAEDYVIKIIFRQFAGISDEETYNKFANAQATSTSASDLYKKLALQLAKNFSKDVSKLVHIYLEETGSSLSDEITATTKAEDLTETYVGIVIDEAELPWRLGVMAQVPVYFDVFTGTVNKDGIESTWGVVTEHNADLQYVTNGKAIADLEYFCMGERGDIYRNINWPHNIETTYLVDPTQSYAVLDVHYSYIGTNEGAQKSEKDLTIVTPVANIAELQKVAKGLAKAAGFSNYKLVNANGSVTDVTTAG